MRTSEYAKWNEEKDIQEFPARVSVCLGKNVNIPTNMYNEYTEKYDGRETLIIETNQVDWVHEYQTNCITIPDMLSELQQFIKKELQNSETKLSRERYLYKLLDASTGWVEQYIDVDEL